MAVRKPVRKSATKAAPKKAAPVIKVDRALQGKYVGKKPTDYHRQFAKWAVSVVGIDLDSVESVRQAFLMGIQMGVTAAADFRGSDFLRDYREANGLTKPGRLPGKTAAVPEPEEIEEDEFDDDEEIDDDEIDDDEIDDEDEFEDDEDDEEDEPEPEPVKPTKRGRPAKVQPAKKATRVAPKKPTPPVDDDEYF